MITKDSTFDECVAEINAAEAEVFADQPEMEGSPDTWVDLADGYLRDADPTVAREVFRCVVGWIPPWLQDRRPATPRECF